MLQLNNKEHIQNTSPVAKLNFPEVETRVNSIDDQAIATSAMHWPT
jgi:hypothetical protein